VLSHADAYELAEKLQNEFGLYVSTMAVADDPFLC